MTRAEIIEALKDVPDDELVFMESAGKARFTVSLESINVCAVTGAVEVPEGGAVVRVWLLRSK